MHNTVHILPSRGDQLVILVVDDEPMIRDIIRIVLEGEGYFILTAADGEEALGLSRAIPEAIHLFLVDVDMPKLDGLQLRERLREERPATRVLLMSGRVPMAADQAFLPKPFGPAVLRKRVRQMLFASLGAQELEGSSQRDSAA
jgi:DNA-binding response OmpR family regulator